MPLGTRIYLGVALSTLLGLAFLIASGLAVERNLQEKLFTGIAASLATLGTASVSAAVIFEDSATAEKLLSAYASLPVVTSVSITLRDGRQLAAWERAEWSNLVSRGTVTAPSLEPSMDAVLQTAINNDAVVAGAPIVVDGEYYGTMTGTLSREALLRSQERAPIYAIGGAVFALILSLVSAHVVQGVVATPILKISRAMRRIAREAYYSDRIEYAGDDALGVVAESFNFMAARFAEREQLLRMARAKAEDAAKAKQLFLANMSHEIRTPMNIVLGALHLALVKVPNSEISDLLHTSHRAANFLLGLINDILDLSKIDNGYATISKSTVKLSDILANQRDLLALHAKENNLVVSTVIAPAANCTVHTDEQKLTQILTNLTANAVKYTHSGTIKLEITLISRSKSEGTFRFLVHDTGIGIEKTAQAHLFEPFFQAEDARNKRYQGTGLGLSISQRLATLLGGKIEVDSKPAEGSTFWLDLQMPILADVADDSLETPQGDAKASISGARVLLVDDTKTSRLIMRALLETAGVNVVEAEDGYEAVRCACDGNGLDAILMDIQMPGMDGVEATGHIHEHFAKATMNAPPIIALTAYAYAEDRAQFLAAGMEDYLSKPVAPDVLFRVLAEHIRST